MKQYNGKFFEDYHIDQEITTSERTLTNDNIMNFAQLSGDFNPLHTDDEFVKSTVYKQRIAHGLLGASISSGLAAQLGIFDGTVLALLKQTINYKKPIFINDTVHLKLKVSEKRELKSQNAGFVTLDTKLYNQNNEVAIIGQWILLVKKKAPKI